MPVKDRLRPMRGLHSMVPGQVLGEGIEVAQAIQRGYIRFDSSTAPVCVHARARTEAAAFLRLAGHLRHAG